MSRVILLVVALTVTACGFDDATAENEHYLDMVCLNEATGHGWPNYKGLAIDCDKRRGPEIGFNP